VSATRDAKGIGLNALGLLAQAALPAFHVQLARFLGAGGYGLYAWAAMFVDVLSVLTLFGCDQAVMRQVSLGRATAANAVGSALRVVLVSGAVVFVVTFCGAPVIANIQHKPGLVGPLRGLALVPLFYHASTILLVATQALGTMRWAFWARSVVQPIVLLGTTSVALRCGWGPSGAALAVAAGMAATTLVVCVFYAGEMPIRETLTGLVSGPLDRETLAVAAPLVVAGVLWALIARIDTFFLGHWGTEVELGAYAACGLYAASVSQVRGVFEPVTGALIAPALARNDSRGLSDAIQRHTRWLAYAVCPLAALLIGFGDPLLRIFGHAFAQGAPALAMLALGHTVNALALTSFALPLSGRGRLTTWVAACTLIAQTVLSALLVPRFGVLGAATALACGLVGAQVAQAVLAARVVGVRGLSWELATTAACALTAVGMAQVVYRVAWDGSDALLVPRFVVAMAVAAVTYVALVLTFAITDDDRSLAMRAIRIRGN
jgi:O-antigen/teichoic acid export membrane protein